MTNLETEMTIMRLDHLANLSEQVVADIRPTLERLQTQCAHLIAAAEVMREWVEELRDEDEVSKLAGSPARRVS
jgi:hypothetical protein